MKLSLLLLIIPQVLSLNLAIYVTLVGKSHLDFVNSMVDALTEKGHHVDVLVGLLGKLEPDIKSARNVTTFTFEEGKNPWGKATHLNDPFEMTSNVDMSFFYGAIEMLVEVGLSNGIPINFLKASKYDAIIVSDYDYFGYAFAKAAGIERVMSFTSTAVMIGQTTIAGLPNPVSCTANLFDNDEPDWSLWYKIVHLYKSAKYHHTLSKLFDTTDRVVQKYLGEDFPPIRELTRNCDMVFTNGHELTEIPRTLSHKIKYIGGLGLRKPKTLAKEFDDILRESGKGAVIISFGTQVPSQNYNIRVKKALLNSFKNFPEHIFIWKYTLQPRDEELFKGITNVRIVDWLPQTDLLYDSRVVGFITHSGLNSLHEYTHAGVPVVSIPLFGDQPHNSRNVERLGIGITVNKLKMDEKMLTSALREILYNEKIINESKHLASLLAKHPEPPRDRFVKWVEFVATHDNVHKQYNLMEASQSIFTYYCIDVILVILLAFIAILSLIKKLVDLILRPVKAKAE